ncbi:MAG: flavin reductase family protein [Proteobacteria bacterium]|jgi:flavin reductase (DIM6/NTAB) family NADH-FMN oxidoreductase RutF|nr:flavin reductase family protein [Pseudomonadota bacterium]MBK8960276.1 flavin reductase family protein [Pseudomonadota bacterium]
MVIDPKSTEPFNIYKLLIGSILPRPIAFVSTMGADGIYNLAPFSFFTAVSANPPCIAFAPMLSLDAKRKDTLNNAERLGEFVVNVVSEDIVRPMNETSAEFPPEVDEFEVSGLTPVPSDLVAVPRVKESHIAMECKLRQVVEMSTLPMGGSLVIGEVVRFHIDDEYFDDFRIDVDKLRPVGRMAGFTYTRTTDRFDLVRPGANAPGKPQR